MKNLTLDDVKVRLQIEDDTQDKFILATLEDICDFVRDYLNIADDEDIPKGLRGTIIKMIELNFNDAGVKRRKTKDVDIEFNNNYPLHIYKALNRYRRLKTL
ncbi:phage head-tail connector protein [Clostridium botulinum]|uniref:phage head-tail connector protein n=1 Tax=Clostridium botulinum TaxID=1491 RepID=UPI001E60D69B|nr:phage head-tail connector protein [Clostridium botulinum]MCD3254381.1 hypothetical protein [Clostridium botulinum C/D]MCD3279881.1 hypothetical protein [Clostridium botulinum C/D]MCD3339612.1 hypothetical protein [Clostridium botulinum C/D]MCD3357520.1 hypothetical protein [Clostridium botulinum C/D]